MLLGQVLVVGEKRNACPSSSPKFPRSSEVSSRPTRPDLRACSARAAKRRRMTQFFPQKASSIWEGCTARILRRSDEVLPVNHTLGISSLLACADRLPRKDQEMEMMELRNKVSWHFMATRSKGHHY